MDRIKSIAVPVTRRKAAARPDSRDKAADNVAYSGHSADFFRERIPTSAKLIHRYRIGQRLAMARGSRDIARAAALCQVVALVPHETGPLLYRVRSDSESFERIVDEVELAPVR